MKKIAVFFLKCLIMLVLVLLFCFRFVMPQYLNNYQAALRYKN